MKLNETKRNIDFTLLKKMQEKGFTLGEVSKYFNCPEATIDYYMRTRGWGRFKRYNSGKADIKIIDALEYQHLTQTQASKILGIKQGNISKRYNQIKEYRKLKEERYKWLKKLEDAKGAEEN